LNLYNLHAAPEELSLYNQRLTNPVIVWGKIMKGRRAGYLADIQKEAKDGRYRDVLKKDAHIATMFARDILLGRFEEAEEEIATSAQWSYVYAAMVLNGRFKLGEDAIATHAGYSLSYALNVLHGRFLAGEEVMKTDDYVWRSYTRNFMRNGET